MTYNSLRGFQLTILMSLTLLLLFAKLPILTIGQADPGKKMRVGFSPYPWVVACNPCRIVVYVQDPDTGAGIEGAVVSIPGYPVKTTGPAGTATFVVHFHVVGPVAVTATKSGYDPASAELDVKEKTKKLETILKKAGRMRDAAKELRTAPLLWGDVLLFEDSITLPPELGGYTVHPELLNMYGAIHFEEYIDSNVTSYSIRYLVCEMTSFDVTIDGVTQPTGTNFVRVKSFGDLNLTSLELYGTMQGTLTNQLFQEQQKILKFSMYTYAYADLEADTYLVDSGGIYNIVRAVGGVWVPVDKFGLLAPYVGVASTIVVATAATAIYVKRIKRRETKNT